MHSLLLYRIGISMCSLFPAITGIEQAVLRRAPFDAPRSPGSASGPVLSRMTTCAAVWNGRGAVVRPRGVGWRTEEPALRGE